MTRQKRVLGQKPAFTANCSGDISQWKEAISGNFFVRSLANM